MGTQLYFIAKFYSIKPIWSYVIFSRRNREVKVNDYSSFILGFKSDFDLRGYVHDPGDEVWLPLLNSPNEMTYFK